MKKQGAEIQQLFEDNAASNITGKTIHKPKSGGSNRSKTTQALPSMTSVTSKPSSSISGSSVRKRSRSRYLNAVGGSLKADREVMTPNTAIKRFG